MLGYAAHGRIGFGVALGSGGSVQTRTMRPDMGVEMSQAGFALTLTVDDLEAVPAVEQQERATSARSGSPTWARRYAVQVAVGDAISLLLAASVATLIRFGGLDANLHVTETTSNYRIVVLATVLLWLLVLAIGGGYDPSILGAGAEELRRIVRAGLHFLAITCILVVALDANLARGYIVAIVPAGVTFALVGRDLNRMWLRRQRHRGRAIRRVLGVGPVVSVSDLALHFQRSRWAGYEVVAVLPSQPHDEASVTVGSTEIPVVGGNGGVASVLDMVDVDIVAVAGDAAMPPGGLRALAWELEGTGVGLAVVPAVTDLAGPRIAFRSVSGLPLLHLEEPRFKGPARALKECTDRIGAALALVALAPVLLVVGILIKATSRGPVLYRQARVGRGGCHFTLLKFRTMVDGADAGMTDLKPHNEVDGPLFKMRNDPRVTPLGHLLRRFSVDEVPQLVNVAKGDMSLVGPRPHLPSEIEEFHQNVGRKLLVKPGMTGLWQVSGRSDLPYEEAVRLDLYYVENWSPSLDLVICARTIYAVLKGRGAY